MSPRTPTATCPCSISSRPGGAARKVRCSSGAGCFPPTAPSSSSLRAAITAALLPWVVAILSTVQLFFLTLNTFVVSPFQVLAVDKRRHLGRRRHGPQPAAAVLGDGHPSAVPLSRLRRLRRPVRVRHGLADLESAGRKLDSHHPPLDPRHLALPEHRRRARFRLGLSRSRLGRLLDVGPG